MARMGRPKGTSNLDKAKVRGDETALDNIGEGWGLLVSFCRWFPDFLLDLLRAEDADYELAFIQRMIMRAKARFQYCDITGSRSLTKSFCSIGEEEAEGTLWPGLKTSYFGPSFKQTAKIGAETHAVIQKNYPALAEHYTVISSGKDTFEIQSAYGSKFSITAFRGLTFHRAIAEEYAQEGSQPFDHETFRAVVKGAMREAPRFRGKVDPTYIQLKQHFITSAGRRQNPSYETRERHFEMINAGAKNMFVMDVPYGVLLLLGMRPVEWAEALKQELTPDEWAREMESRYTGSDQNPVVRDETLTDSRQLMLMEEHHCCKDADCKEKPGDVIYVVGYDVSYADGAANAKCAALVLKLTKQSFFLKRDKYLKQVVWIDDWAPVDPARQAQRLKNLWWRFCCEGSQTYIAIDAWQFGTAVLLALMGDLQDGLAPLCVWDHSSFTEYEMDGAVPVICPIKAGGAGTTDPDSDMLRYAILQFENRNVQLLTSNYQDAMDAYKRYHRVKDDRGDRLIYRPYAKTTEMIGQIQNLKTVPSGSGMSERRISHHIQRDSWSALKYALRMAEKLEKKFLMRPERKSDWDEAFKSFEKSGRTEFSAAVPNTRVVVGRRGGKLF